MTEAAANPVGRTRLVAPAVVALAVVLGTWVVVDQWTEVRRALGDLAWWSAPGAFVAGAAGVYAIFRSWAGIVADHGVVLSPRQALRIYGVGQAGKYLPGSVWSVLTQAQMAREYGGSRARMAAASLVALLLSVVVALGLGALVLPFANGAAAERFWYAPVFAVGLGVLLVPAVLNRVVALGARLLRRPADSVRLTGRAVLRAGGWAVMGNLFFGLHLLALGATLGLGDLRGYLLAVAAYSLAAGLGVVFVIAPAGAGVREFVITVVLAVSVSTGTAVTIALLSRVLLLVVDLLLALTQVRAVPAPGAQDVVFVTRRFPPSVGGMETLAAGVWRSVSALRPGSVLIAHGGSNRGLLWWLPVAWLRVAGLVLRRRVGLVLVGDAPTFAALLPVLAVSRVPSAVMVMGLDVTYDNPVYRAVVPRALRRAGSVIAISQATRDATIAAGVPEPQVAVLRLGVAPPAPSASREESRERVVEALGLGPDHVLLLTLGRLVRRKGVRWLVAEVLPGLPEHVHYVIAGDGPESEQIRAAAQDAGVADRVHLLGRVDDQVREDLMRGCDVFVQPNVAVPGDMEGFGLVTIEAAMRDAVVVAADLEGIKDAVVPGETGILVVSADAGAWLRTLDALVRDAPAREATGRAFGERTRELYSEAAMGAELCRILEEDGGAAAEERAT